MKIVQTIDLSQLAALTCLAAVKDVRYYLQGVAIIRGYLVATDGFVLGAFPLQGFKNDCPEIIIPCDAILAIRKKFKKPGIECDVYFNEETKEGYLTLSGSTTAEKEYFKAIDGKYVPFEKVMVSKPTGELKGAHFDLELGLKFYKAAKMLGVSSPRCSVTFYPGEIPEARIFVCIESVPEFSGVLIPLRK